MPCSICSSDLPVVAMGSCIDLRNATLMALIDFQPGIGVPRLNALEAPSGLRGLIAELARDLSPQRRQFLRRAFYARPLDRYVGEQTGRACGEEEQPISKAYRLLDVVRHQQGGNRPAY